MQSLGDFDRRQGTSDNGSQLQINLVVMLLWKTVKFYINGIIKSYKFERFNDSTIVFNYCLDNDGSPCRILFSTKYKDKNQNIDLTLDNSIFMKGREIFFEFLEKSNCENDYNIKFVFYLNTSIKVLDDAIKFEELTDSKLKELFDGNETCQNFQCLTKDSIKELFGKLTSHNTKIVQKNRKFLENAVFITNSPLTLKDKIKPDMVKFIKDDFKIDLHGAKLNDEYEMIYSEVQHWWRGSGSLTQTCMLVEKTLKCFYSYNAPERLGKYVSQEGKCEEIHKYHLEYPKKIVVVSGMKYIGKKTCVREYVEKFKQHYDGNIIWIDCENFETDYKTLATHLFKNQENILSWQQYFSDRKYLIIYQNANDKSFLDKFNSFDTNYGSAYYLFISDKKHFGSSCSYVDLGALDVDKAKEFVCKSLGTSDQSKAEKFARIFKCHPLALQQGINYIQEQRDDNSLEKFLQDHQSINYKLLDKVFSGHLKNKDGHVYTIFNILDGIRNDKNLIQHFLDSILKESVNNNGLDIDREDLNKLTKNWLVDSRFQAVDIVRLFMELEKK